RARGVASVPSAAHRGDRLAPPPPLHRPRPGRTARLRRPLPQPGPRAHPALTRDEAMTGGAPEGGRLPSPLGVREHGAMARILVTEQLAERGLAMLREAGHDVDERLGLSPQELLEAVRGVHALIIRSATKVTADVLEAATELIVVGRAGIGLDNVDVGAATRRGVMVANAPMSNSVSMAEHTIALLLAQARNI